MITKICTYICNLLIKEGHISVKEKDVYIYLFSCILDEIIYDVVAITVGAISRRAVIALLFLITTTPLRYFAGGYHATTPMRCAILSYTILFFVLFFPKTLFCNCQGMILMTYFICVVIISLISPVDSANKRFTDAEKKNLHKKVIITVLLICIIQLILWYNKLIQYTATVTLCVFICTASLLAGYIRNKRNESKKSQCSDL